MPLINKNNSPSHLRPSLLTLAIAQALIMPLAHSAIITIDNTADDTTGCTLREAITSINAGSDQGNGCLNTGTFGVDDTLTFSISTVTLSNSKGPLNVNKNLVIDGGAGVSIIGDAGRSSGILTLDQNGTNIALNNLTISGGSAATYGGGIYVNNSTVSLSNSTVSDNSASDYAGGIYAGGSSVLTISNSTVSGNSAADLGGGIYAGTSSVLTINNSTVSGNSANRGGGIYVGESLTINNSTVSGNSANRGGGISGGYGSTISINNSIIANSTGGNCYNNSATFIGDQHNLIEGGGCGSPGAVEEDPKLEPLQDNGGATFTHALLAGSPAIGKADTNKCPAEDQRGKARDAEDFFAPIGGPNNKIIAVVNLSGECDIGAVEFGDVD